MKKKLEEVKSLLQSSPPPTFTAEDFLSTGSTLLDLALTNQPGQGFCKGSYYLLVGASRAGKTFIALTTLAEASINPSFQDYALIYLAPERGARMNIEKFFGKKLAERIIFEYPKSLQEFY